MTTEFKDQGGISTMDPKPLRRWLVSKAMTFLFSPSKMEQRRTKAEKQRIRNKEPHRVEYFHQVDDGYSHLVAQRLQALVSRYDIELQCHLVAPVLDHNAPEPELLARLSRYDAFHVAPEYGLEFPGRDGEPDSQLVQRAQAILSAQDNSGFIQCAAQVGQALWAGDEALMASLAEEYGEATAAQVEERINAGNQRRTDLKHYSGAMLHYGNEWYWGVDRFYHLEKRLASYGADRHQGQAPLVPRPDIQVGENKDEGTLTLEVYASMRSPYTAIVFDRAVKLAQDTGVNLVVRPVLPMVMRGVPATKEKGLYIFMDTSREAHEAGVAYGNFYDPIGNPARRCYSLYPWAVEQGKGVELLSSFLRHAFVKGVNTNTDKGLRQVVESVGLDWSEALTHLGKPGWEAVLEGNRQTMYEAGLWGVPSFRLINKQGEQILGLWGQDRLWLVAREIQRQLQNG